MISIIFKALRKHFVNIYEIGTAFLNIEYNLIDLGLKRNMGKNASYCKKLVTCRDFYTKPLKPTKNQISKKLDQNEGYKARINATQGILNTYSYVNISYLLFYLILTLHDFFLGILEDSLVVDTITDINNYSVLHVADTEDGPNNLNIGIS